MIHSYPTEEELRDRIESQLGRRGPTDAVALIWRGYLSGLLEWGLIEVDMFDRLCKLIPKVGHKELFEMCTGESLSPELEREIEESIRREKP